MQRIEQRECVILENCGEKIFGVMHRPLKISLPTYPALLMCHGLGGHKTGKYRLYVNLASKLSELGIASLRIDFRGSGDSEGNFADMTLEGEVSDALKGLEFLKHDPKIDSSSIGLFGRSVGGTVALMAARRFGAIKSLAIWAPLFNGDQWIDKWNLLHSAELSEEHRLMMMRINGQVPGYEFFKQLFNIRMEEEIKELDKTPLLHIHGELDNVIDIDHADKYAQQRQHSKGKTKFIRLPRSDHDFSHPQEQQLAINETCQWFEQTLKQK